MKELGWFENCLLWQGKKKNRGKLLHRFALVAKFWILTNGGPANMAEKEFKKNKKWTLVTFLCIITRRNKTVAYTFLEFNFFFRALQIHAKELFTTVVSVLYLVIVPVSSNSL